jgi:hypothetical protein
MEYDTVNNNNNNNRALSLTSLSPLLARRFQQRGAKLLLLLFRDLVFHLDDGLV